jgi:hypothetical protein
MKIKNNTHTVILAASLSTLFLAAGPVRGDELSDLKKRLTELEKKYSAVKKWQEKEMKKADKGFSGASNENVAKAVEAYQKKIDIDRPLASEPAFLALGLEGEQVPEIMAPRRFASGLVNGIDKSGKLKTGIALSTNLGELYDYTRAALIEKRADPQNVTNYIDRYDNPENPDQGTLKGTVGLWMARTLYRSNFSLATAKGSESTDKSLRLALGLSTILYDRYDPTLMDKEEMAAVRLELGLDEDASRQEVFAAIAEGRWLRSGVQAAIAPTWLSEDAKFQGLQSEGYTAYLATTWIYQPGMTKNRVPLNIPGRKPRIIEQIDPKKPIYGITGHVRYRAEEAFAAAGGLPAGEQDTLYIGGRLTWGWKDMNVGIEGAYLKIWDGPTGDENAWRASGALSTRIAKDTYFVISTGQTFGAQDEFFALGGIRLGSSENASLFPDKN